MSDAREQARAYVEDLRQRGIPEAEIAQLLRQAGWNEAQIAALVLVPPVPPAPQAPPTPAGSGLATAALIMGLLSLLLPLAAVTGPLAVIFGAVALSKRRPGAAMATVGIILGIVCWILMLFVVPILAAILFPVFARAREKAMQVSCLSNVQQLSMAMSMYRADNNEAMPVAVRWPQQVNQYVTNPQLYLCPADQRPEKQAVGGLTTSYTMSQAVGGLRIGAVKAPDRLASLFDGSQIAGGRDAAEFRHQHGLNVGYADGHVCWLSESAFGEVALSPAQVSPQPPPAEGGEGS
jgi:prepilin-type processing-associated H-X9-DG protein